jgi:tetratricopeptide (TPR) repeat protein
MIRRLLPATLIVCVLWVQSGFAVRAQDLYLEAADALFNLDFDSAQPGFESLTEQYPDNPDYWNALASVFWFKILYDQQKLSLESYAAKSFGTDESGDTINPDDDQRFRKTVQTAIDKAQAVMDHEPNDVRALYALGASNSLLASYESVARHAYFAAYEKARMARHLHEEVLKLDPGFDDARLAVGVFDYVVAQIPAYIRFTLGLLLGMKGDGKEAGIEQIEAVAARGSRLSTDAKMVLLVIYNRERAYDRALQLADDLHARYPRNFLFEMGIASLFGKMQQWDQAHDTYQEILKKVESHTTGYERLRYAKVYRELGTSQMELHKEDDALVTLSNLVRTTDATPDEIAEAHLSMGKIFDAREDREHAGQNYDAVLGLGCAPELKKQAEALKKKLSGG